MLEERNPQCPGFSNVGENDIFGRVLICIRQDGLFHGRSPIGKMGCTPAGAPFPLAVFRYHSDFFILDADAFASSQVAGYSPSNAYSGKIPHQGWGTPPVHSNETSSIPRLRPRLREYFRASFQCSCTPRLARGVPDATGSYTVPDGGLPGLRGFVQVVVRVAAQLRSRAARRSGYPGRRNQGRRDPARPGCWKPTSSPNEAKRYTLPSLCTAE